MTKSKAYQLGKAGFESDTATAPCQCKDLMKMIESGKFNNIEIMSDWNRGWHVANLQNDSNRVESALTQ